MTTPSGEEHLSIDQQTVGRARWHWAWWTGDPAVFVASVDVDPEHRRRGHGTRLFALACDRVREIGAHALTGWVASDAHDALGFVSRMGYVETGQRQQTCTLDLTATTSPELGRGPIASLSELKPSEVFLQELHQMDGEGAGSFEDWRTAALLGEGQSYDTTWVWLEGGRPVGMTYLTRQSYEEYENDFTVVHPDFRRRGIATGLKRHAIAWGIRNGAKRFSTSSLLENVAMREVNRRLGYVEGPRLIEFELQLPS